MATYGAVKGTTSDDAKESAGGGGFVAIRDAPPEQGNKVSPPTDDEALKAKEDEEEQQESAIMKQLTKFSKLVVPCFVILGLICLALTIIGAVKVVSTIDVVFLMLLCALVACVCGAYGTYKFGVISDQINRLQHENDKYNNEIQTLRGTRGMLKGEVDQVQESVNSLQSTVDSLETQLTGFSDLRTQLEQISQDNETIADLVDATNSMFSDMNTAALRAKRSHLLSIYYECELRDQEEGMSEAEYKRFLSRLGPEQRQDFEKLGTFAQLAGDDGVLDLHEFQGMLDRMLAVVEEEKKEAEAHE